MNDLKDIWYGSQIHIDIIARDARLKILDHIKQTKIERKQEELSAKRMGKLLHKVFKADAKQLNNLLSTLVESGS